MAAFNFSLCYVDQTKRMLLREPWQRQDVTPRAQNPNDL